MVGRTAMSTGAPLVKTYLTDFVDQMKGHHQDTPICNDFELNLYQCFEAYGTRQGIKVCRDEYDDMKECLYGNTQRFRLMAMDKERRRQYWLGKRKQHYQEDPPLESYKNPNFYRTDPSKFDF
ncbi:Ndufs5 [Cordylochernes scorpioides]|uniref:Ndufs5 n=1 Tax=Cordylochernes scorpioides TaxID=51811 RepID=A0ABY6KPW8_9ARAC|nr:Ndufs5 [Cordylochernes scorpioides]